MRQSAPLLFDRVPRQESCLSPLFDLTVLPGNAAFIETVVVTLRCSQNIPTDTTTFAIDTFFEITTYLRRPRYGPFSIIVYLI